MMDSSFHASFQNDDVKMMLFANDDRNDAQNDHQNDKFPK